MILIEKILMKKILMKKIRNRIAEYTFDFKQFMKYSYNLHDSYNEVNF